MSRTVVATAARSGTQGSGGPPTAPAPSAPRTPPCVRRTLCTVVHREGTVGAGAPGGSGGASRLGGTTNAYSFTVGCCPQKRHPAPLSTRSMPTPAPPPAAPPNATWATSASGQG